MEILTLTLTLIPTLTLSYVRADHAPEDRLVTPNPWATLGVHIVISQGSHGALERGGLVRLGGG